MQAKQFEREAVAFLKSLQLKVVGYYPYEHCSDILGYLPAQQPFTFPTRVMVEILKTKPSVPIIESFSKISRNAGAQCAIILSQDRWANLDAETRSLISESKIEYIGEGAIADFVQKAGETLGSLALEDFAPSALARCLPELAKQVIPRIMQKTATELKLQAWEIFEDAVHSVFHFCFNYTVKKFGKETLFEHEPEGAVLVQDPKSFAFIYECKTAKESYHMSSDHELRYCNYIQNKKPYVKYLYNSELQYLAIIAPSFTGDIEQRRERIYQNTGVLTVFLPAQALSELGLWVCELPSQVKRLVDLTEIFKIRDTEVSADSIRTYMIKFESETKNRY